MNRAPTFSRKRSIGWKKEGCHIWLLNVDLYLFTNRTYNELFDGRLNKFMGKKRRACAIHGRNKCAWDLALLEDPVVAESVKS